MPPARDPIVRKPSRKPVKVGPRKTTTTVGPQGLPQASGGTQKPRTPGASVNPAPATSVGPQGLRTQGTSTQRSRPDRHRERTVRRAAARARRERQVQLAAARALGEAVSQILNGRPGPTPAQRDIYANLSPYERQVLMGAKSGPVRPFVGVQTVPGLPSPQNARERSQQLSFGRPLAPPRATALSTETGERVPGWATDDGFKPTTPGVGDDVMQFFNRLADKLEDAVAGTPLVSTGGGPRVLGTGGGGRIAAALSPGAAPGSRGLGRVASDLFMVPAAAPQAIYEAAAAGVELAQGKTDRAQGLVEDFLDSATGRILKGDFDGAWRVAQEHPGFVILEASGVASVIGRGAGMAGRSGVLGKTARDLTSVERAPLHVVGDLVIPRRYSRDAIRKIFQVIGDRQRERSNERQGRRPDQAREKEADRFLRRDAAETVDLNVESGRNARRDVEGRLSGRRSPERLPSDRENPVQALMVEGRVTPRGFRNDLDRIEARLAARERELIESGDPLQGNRLAGLREQLGQVRQARQRLDAGKLDPAAEYERLRPAVRLLNELDDELAALGHGTPERMRTARNQPAKVEHFDAVTDQRRRKTPEYVREQEVRQRTERHRAEVAQAAKSARRALMRSARSRVAGPRQSTPKMRYRISVEWHNGEPMPGGYGLYDDLKQRYIKRGLTREQAERLRDQVEHENGRLVGGVSERELSQSVEGALRDPETRQHAKAAGSAYESLRDANREVETARRQLRLAVEKNASNEPAARDRLKRALDRRKRAQKAWREARKPLVEALGGVDAKAVQAMARYGAAVGKHETSRAVLSASKVPRGRRTFVPGDVDPKTGERIANEAAESRLASLGAPEAAFISHRPYVQSRVKVASRQGTSGRDRAQMSGKSRTDKSTRDSAYQATRETIVTEAQRKAVTIEAIRSVNRTFNRYALGAKIDADGRPVGFKDRLKAEDHADAIARAGGPPMVVVSMNPGVLTRRETAQAIARDVEVGDVEQAMLDAGVSLDRMVWSESNPVEGPYVLMPETVVQTFREFEKLIADGNFARAFEAVSGNFRQVVLATSVRWIFGNVAEAEVRGVSAGINPAHRALGRKLVRDAKALGDERQVREFETQVFTGGAVGSTHRTQRRRSADQFTGEGSIAQFARVLGRARDSKPGQVLELWRIWKDGVFALNNRFERRLEVGAIGKKAAQDAGGVIQAYTRALKSSDGAMSDLVRGMLDTHNQREYARFVDDVRGRYSKLTPGLKRAVLSYAPFAMWYINALKFVGVTLPAHRPVQTAALAAYAEVHEDIRRIHDGLLKADKLYMRGLVKVPANVPLLGLKKGDQIPLQRYVPFGALSDPLAGPDGLLLPQFSFVQNWAGYDFAYNRLRGPDGQPTSLVESFVTGLYSIAETMTPFAIPAERVLEKGGTPAAGLNPLATRPGTSSTIAAGVKKAFNPLSPYRSSTTGGGSSEPAPEPDLSPMQRDRLRRAAESRRSRSAVDAIQAERLKRARARRTP